jgi:hypothetical protein
MTAFSKETIHDVKDVIVTRRTVKALNSTWDSFDVEIVDMEGNSKALLLFAAEGKTMRFQRREDDEN